MLVILMTSLLEEQLKAVTVVLRVKQVEKAVGERQYLLTNVIFHSLPITFKQPILIQDSDFHLTSLDASCQLVHPEE